MSKFLTVPAMNVGDADLTKYLESVVNAAEAHYNKCVEEVKALEKGEKWAEFADALHVAELAASVLKIARAKLSLAQSQNVLGNDAGVAGNDLAKAEELVASAESKKKTLQIDLDAKEARKEAERVAVAKRAEAEQAAAAKREAEKRTTEAARANARQRLRTTAPAAYYELVIDEVVETMRQFNIEEEKKIEQALADFKLWREQLAVGE
jgi:hypothetical protein